MTCKVTVHYKDGTKVEYKDLRLAMLAIWEKGSNTAKYIVTPEGKFLIREVFK